MTSVTQRTPHNGARADGDDNKETVLRRPEPPFLTKLRYASYMYGLQSVLGPMLWLRDWKESRNPPPGHPDIVKTYECRPGLPVRIFFPSSYDQTSAATLPTLFTIHGGGFCIGHQRDDDEWNRAFADAHSVLVISLNYSKAPAAPFPAAPHDVEALLLAALADASLPIDRTTDGPTTRTAILGFSAGGNLALAVSQLPTIHTHPLAPAAVTTIYGCLDLSHPPQDKLPNRPWKPSLPLPRGEPADTKRDPLIGLAPVFDWSYIPYGQDLRDPLLSPHYAPREALPRYVCVIAAELDMLAHESWRFASRLSREWGGNKMRKVPERESGEAEWRVCGNFKGEVTCPEGELVLGGDERFAFEETWEGGGGGGVKWLLVPDVVHGFDNPHLRALLGGGAEAARDAERKTEAYVAELGRWLKEVVWRV